MNKIKLKFLIILLLFATNVFATSLNGRFVVVKSDSSKLSLLLQINTNTGNDDMGGATMVISFDKNILEFSNEPIKDKDYKFLNFNGGNYSNATVTKPLSDKIWINIVLPPENDNKGTVVSGINGWTDVVILNFDINSKQDTSEIKWLVNNIFWQVYDGDNVTTWSSGSFIDLVNSPSNVELISYTAQLLDNSNIQLNWNTICYADNSGYEIERSVSKSSGQSSTIGTNWETIGFINSNKILNTSTNYSLIDKNVPANSNLKYRLKSINIDATSVILKEVDISTPGPSNFELSQNYPNPFNPSTKIGYIIPELSGSGQISKVVLKVFDILGNEIATLVNQVQEPGKHEVEFKAGNLASGVYIYRLDTGSFTDTKKMILLR